MDGFFNILLIIDAVLAGIAFIVLIVKSERLFYSAGNAKKTELVAISDGGTVKLLSDPNSKSAAVEEKVILSPEDTIKAFIEKRDQLDKKMDEKLKEIMDLLGVK